MHHQTITIVVLRAEATLVRMYSMPSCWRQFGPAQDTLAAHELTSTLLRVRATCGGSDWRHNGAGACEKVANFRPLANGCMYKLQMSGRKFHCVQRHGVDAEEPPGRS